MARTIRAVFDGEVLRPEHPDGLLPHTTYLLTIEEAAPPAGASEDMYPLTDIAHLATDMGVADLAERHDCYAHRGAGDDREPS